MTNEQRQDPGHDNRQRSTLLTKAAIIVLVAGAAAAVLAALLLGGSQEHSVERVSLAETQPDVSRADPRLKQIVAQSNELLGGTTKAYDARLRELRGIPVVVNKWASWCNPCKLEFPHFQKAAKQLGGRIAFLGVNSNDAAADARSFLDVQPLPFPSYSDPRLEIANRLRGMAYFPATGFYDAEGNLVHVKAGQYRTLEQLRGDINRYALGLG